VLLYNKRKSKGGLGFKIQNSKIHSTNISGRRLNQNYGKD
jgi:hypothetical protein